MAAAPHGDCCPSGGQGGAGPGALPRPELLSPTPPCLLPLPSLRTRRPLLLSCLSSLLLLLLLLTPWLLLVWGGGPWLLLLPALLL